ncbi:hypothetical protein EON78_00130 [bacterium]|nr:MAG: hypothetical protein EON78_00130 [bacterium]
MNESGEPYYINDERILASGEPVHILRNKAFGQHECFTEGLIELGGKMIFNKADVLLIVCYYEGYSVDIQLLIETNLCHTERFSLLNPYVKSKNLAYELSLYQKLKHFITPDMQKEVKSSRTKFKF